MFWSSSSARSWPSILARQYALSVYGAAHLEFALRREAKLATRDSKLAYGRRHLVVHAHSFETGDATRTFPAVQCLFRQDPRDRVSPVEWSR